MIRAGADVNAPARNGSTALHAAAFLGHDEAARTLVRHGARVDARNGEGNGPLYLANLDEGTTRFYASMLGLPLIEEGLADRKAAIADLLREHGAPEAAGPSLTAILMGIPLFHHLWFLWFLWWLVLGLAAVSALGARLPTFRLPARLVLSPARYLWLIPLTMIPQAFMTPGLFGPDTSAGLLPIPHVLAYYAIFFGFGALYYQYDDPTDRVGRRWWLPLAIGLLLVFPAGLALAEGRTGPAALAFALDAPTRRVLSVFLQAAYPWLLTFGLMGLARRYFPTESPTWRYLSDSAYWLYLAHLPLVIAAQDFVRDWPLPALLKFLLVVAGSTALLLLTYQTLVRHTWLGRFLNGPRPRRSRPALSNVAPG